MCRVLDSQRLISEFLAQEGWDKARRSPLAGDASDRRYERLVQESGRTSILMIAPPESGEQVRSFSELARHLSGHGFSAPLVFAEDVSSGLLLIEDLGDGIFARLAEKSRSKETTIYGAAVDCLLALHKASLPSDLSRMTPRSLAMGTDLAAIWYAQKEPDPIVLDTLESRLSSLSP
ncbi:MAG: phosphotransferase, partial [Pseudomonadota bacterium]